MTYRSLIITALVWAAPVAPLWPASTPVSSTGTLRMADVLTEADAANPEILAAKKRWEAVHTRRAVAATPEKPWLTFERMYGPRDKDVISGATEKSVAVSQELPFPTTLLLRGREAAREADIAEEVYRARRLDIRARVKRAFAMLYLAHHTLHIYEENTELMRQFASVAEAKYASGKGTQVDVLKAQVELSKMLNMLVSLQQEKQTAAAMLNVLLNRSPGAPLGDPEELEPRSVAPTVERVEELALSRQPQLRAAGLTVDRNRTALHLARSEFLPDLMLTYRRREMTDGMKSHDAELGLSLPFWFWRPAAMTREARAELDMSRAEFDAMSNMTRYDVRSALVRVQTMGRLVELYHSSVLPQAEQSLRVTSAAYEADRVDFLDLLDSVRTLREFRLEHYQHIADFETAVGDLERLVGVESLIIPEAGQ